MKTIVKRLVRDEKGQSLVMVLILLLIGGLIIGPLLSYMGTGLITGNVYERRADELYAADAGVEDAIWKIQTGEVRLCTGQPIEPPFNINVNGKSVTVYIEYPDEGTYKITSIATTDNDGGTADISNSSMVEAYLSVSYLDLSPLLEHAIISNGNAEIDVDLSGKTTVIGTIWLPDDNPDNYKFGPNVEYDPEKILDSDDIPITWPEYGDLSVYYLGLLEDPVDPGASINILYMPNISDSYRNGPLTIDNTGDPATLTLNGTLYVAGNLEFEQSGSNDYTINLNGNTIFVEGSITCASHRISFSGSGCIIAKEDINFRPGIASEDGEFVLFMSVTGDAHVNPQGDFTGCIAASGQVDLHPDGNIEWIPPEDKGLNFPGMEDDDELPPIVGMNIYSWEVSPPLPWEDLGE